MQFTKRQQVLLGRLQVLLDRIAAWPLPLDIAEVLGFGSFFRQKAKPRDLDLEIRWSEQTRLYEGFVRLMDKLYDHWIESNAETPLAGLEGFRSQIPERLLDTIRK